MKDKELRKLIGSRVKQRRLELNLTQPYVAEKMGVTASTILRYENGSIDNTSQTDIAKTIGFESNDEYNEIMFLREITHTINAFNEMADVVRLYSKKPKTAEQRLFIKVLYEDSESV